MRSFTSLFPLLVAGGVAGRAAAQSVAYVRQVANVGSSQTITDIQDAGDGSGRLFVVTKDGRIRVVRFPNDQVNDVSADTASVTSVFVNIASRISTNSERGLLGLAFHPSYAANGYFFVHYSDGSTGDAKIGRCRAVPPSSDSAVCDVVLKTIDQTYANHNGGQIQFGTDGYLYIAMGDGGSSNDPQGDAQAVSNCDGGTGSGSGKNCYLGKMLRVDVNNFAAGTWSVPGDNPCVLDPNCFGTDGSIPPEVWSIGLRNPWRFSFDSQTGDMLIADVGQNAREWVHFQPANSVGEQNYGWCSCEGTRNNFRTQCPQPTSGTCLNTNGQFVPPAIEYSQISSTGRCIIGGYVYRGNKYPDLQGEYFYGDYVSKNMWMAQQNGGVWSNVTNPSLPSSPTTFGQDTAGNIFVGTSNSQLYLIRSTATPNPTAPPTGIPTQAPVTAGQPTFSPISVGVTCPLFYENTEVLSSGIELDYSVVMEEAPHNGIFCARLRYSSLAWVSVGLSPSGMVGAEPVIYKPLDGAGSILKYSISSRNKAGVVLMTQQTLLGSSFSQTATHTVMEFSKLLKEPDASELEIVNGANNFVFAVGSSNSFTTHSERGSFTLNLALDPTSPPTMAPTDSPSKAPIKAPTGSPSKAPTNAPSTSPTTRSPSEAPTKAPTTSSPTNSPSQKPTSAPSASPTSKPSSSPSNKPTTAAPQTASPTTSSPTNSPSQKPTSAPSASPSNKPTAAAPQTASPTTSSPTSSPSQKPTSAPSASPTSKPSTSPSNGPTTAAPQTASPTTSKPTNSPSQKPTPAPSANPTSAPSSSPSTKPTTAAPQTSPPTTSKPTNSPSQKPTSASPTPVPTPPTPQCTGRWGRCNNNPDNCCNGRGCFWLWCR